MTYNEAGQDPQVFRGGESGFVEENRVFVDCLLSDRRPPINHVDGLMATLMVLQAFASLKSGRPSVKGGGNVLSQGVHSCDILRFMAGADPVAVYAAGGNYYTGTGVIDNLAATFRFANGVRGVGFRVIAGSRR